MGTFRYIDDRGNFFRIRLDASNATAVGATPAAGTEPSMPKNLKPRYLLARLPSGRTRRIVAPDSALAIWANEGQTVTLPDFANSMAPATATVMGRVGERRYARD